MGKSSTVFFLLLFLPIWAVAQEEKEITGKVVDKSTLEPVSVVRISSSLERISTDDHGKFTIRAKVGDSLTFVHLTYQPLTMVANGDDNQFQLIQLEERTLEMREFEVTGMPSEQTFKEAILNTTADHAMEMNMMQRNVNMIMIIKDLSYFHDYSSYDMLLKNINQEGGVTLFSSNPSMGLISTFKRLFSGKGQMPNLSRDPVDPGKTRPLWKNPLESDSVKIE
ncbi:carboxypeptidase-like regulatory domain-containing protein [Echinicola soli]|uniref:Carboxypeptidase-like regulatory domain-containing protein n=1 Tax=Echinicola soli TaxID=2591634 RepID=A0A514CEX6_9BACT|nr:carboxypeptidase-like regulatory domain-containing protein [Echinicola soli]QDH78373.1 carboxypeptidase-like regulatory domain-containing protein [Echinicola soli]